MTEATERTSASLVLGGLTKDYRGIPAVDGVSLEVGPGKLVALLGPSGCGKTTTLRMVAGFVAPSRGTISVSGRDVTRLPPHKRDMGMVFQSYALFPHLTVAENIAFGLRRRPVPRAERDVRVRRMAEMLKLDTLLDRLPRQLSGGQQQRVAVGRALVISPTVLLLDEPFSNLDAQLREVTRTELRRIQLEFGITTLFVTHDQSEAMAIADTVAVMNAGRLVQADAPAELYRRPSSKFVANFIGRANLIDVERIESESSAHSTVMRGPGGLLFALDGDQPPRGSVVLRPELVRIDPEGCNTQPNNAPGQIDGVSFLGPVAHMALRLPGDLALVAEIPGAAAARFPIGSTVRVSWDATSLSCVSA